MRTNSSTIFAIAFIFIMLANGFSFSTFILAIVLFSIFRSVLGKEDRRNPHQNSRHRERERRSRQGQATRRRPAEQTVRREFERSQAQKAPRAPKPKPKPKNNPFKKSGIEKYKDYDYDGAISDFEKALGIDPTDVVVHFNIACAYSLTEDKDKAYFHISKAVENGFNDFEKIQTHDALAYIRIQEEYDGFVKNAYRIKEEQSAGGTDKVSSDLLEQLQKLAELKEKGLLTEEEFLMQKKKLLR